MKKNEFVLIVLLLIFAVIISPTPVTAAASVPKAVVPEFSYNFRPVPEGAKIAHEFVIKNKGDAPLHIQRVKTG